jgi:hypothetical protein
MLFCQIQQCAKWTVSKFVKIDHKLVKTVLHDKTFIDTNDQMKALE